MTTALSSLPQHLQDTLAAERAVIAAGRKVHATGGAEAACVEHDAAVAAEEAAYKKMNALGLTRSQWAAYDRIRAAMYRNA